MYCNSRHANQARTASPYEQPEPPFYLLPREAALLASTGKILRRIFRCRARPARIARALAALTGYPRFRDQIAKLVYKAAERSTRFRNSLKFR